MARESPTEAQTRSVIDAHLQSGVTEYRVVHHHCNTHVYVTTNKAEKVIIRVCDGPWWTDDAAKEWKFQRERVGWQVMSALDGISVPHVLVVDASKAFLPYPYLIMTHIPGTPMSDVFPTLDVSGRLDLIRQLGRVVGRVHELPFDPVFIPEQAMRWTGCRESMREDLVELSDANKITGRGRQRMEHFLEVHGSLLDKMDKDVVFLHGDIAFRNTHLQEEAGRWRVSGLVDGELSGFGPRGRELRVLEPLDFRPLQLPRMREVFLDGYGSLFPKIDYRMAYLSAELSPMYPNEELLAEINSQRFSEDLEWLDIF